MTTYTTRDAARKLDLSWRSIAKYCIRYRVGEKIGRDWILTDIDLSRIKARMGKRGRPTRAGSR